MATKLTLLLDDQASPALEKVNQRLQAMQDTSNGFTTNAQRQNAELQRTAGYYADASRQVQILRVEEEKHVSALGAAGKAMTAYRLAQMANRNIPRVTRYAELANGLAPAATAGIRVGAATGNPLAGGHAAFNVLAAPLTRAIPSAGGVLGGVGTVGTAGALLYGGYKLDNAIMNNTGLRAEAARDSTGRYKDGAQELAQRLNRSGQSADDFAKQAGKSLDELGLKVTSNNQRIKKAWHDLWHDNVADTTDALKSLGREAAQYLKPISDAGKYVWKEFDRSMTNSADAYQTNIRKMGEGFDYLRASWAQVFGDKRSIEAIQQEIKDIRQLRKEASEKAALEKLIDPQRKDFADMKKSIAEIRQQRAEASEMDRKTAEMKRRLDETSERRPYAAADERKKVIEEIDAEIRENERKTEALISQAKFEGAEREKLIKQRQALESQRHEMVMDNARREREEQIKAANDVREAEQKRKADIDRQYEEYDRRRKPIRDAGSQYITDRRYAMQSNDPGAAAQVDRDYNRRKQDLQRLANARTEDEEKGLRYEFELRDSQAQKERAQRVDDMGAQREFEIRTMQIQSEYEKQEVDTLMAKRMQLLQAGRKETDDEIRAREDAQRKLEQSEEKIRKAREQSARDQLDAADTLAERELAHQRLLNVLRDNQNERDLLAWQQKLKLQNQPQQAAQQQQQNLQQQILQQQQHAFQQMFGGFQNPVGAAPGQINIPGMGPNAPIGGNQPIGAAPGQGGLFPGAPAGGGAGAAGPGGAMNGPALLTQFMAKIPWSAIIDKIAMQRAGINQIPGVPLTPDEKKRLAGARQQVQNDINLERNDPQKAQQIRARKQLRDFKRQQQRDMRVFKSNNGSAIDRNKFRKQQAQQRKMMQQQFRQGQLGQRGPGDDVEKEIADAQRKMAEQAVQDLEKRKLINKQQADAMMQSIQIGQQNAQFNAQLQQQWLQINQALDAILNGMKNGRQQAQGGP